MSLGLASSVHVALVLLQQVENEAESSSLASAVITYVADHLAVCNVQTVYVYSRFVLKRLDESF